MCYTMRFFNCLFCSRYLFFFSLSLSLDLSPSLSSLYVFFVLSFSRSLPLSLCLSFCLSVSLSLSLSLSYVLCPRCYSRLLFPHIGSSFAFIVSHLFVSFLLSGFLFLLLALSSLWRAGIILPSLLASVSIPLPHPVTETSKKQPFAVMSAFLVPRLLSRAWCRFEGRWPPQLKSAIRQNVVGIASPSTNPMRQR